MVSAVLVIVFATATLNIIDRSGASAATNENRTIAANLAQADLNRMRMMQIDDVVDDVKLNPQHQQTVKGKNFTTTSTAIWTSDVGDTNLLPGILVDKLEFRRTNEALQQCVKVADPGDTDFQAGDIVPKETLDETYSAIEADGQTPASVATPKPAIGSTQLLGITKAAVQSESFISAASFQETTKVLTEAAMAGATDTLIGLKENVILGHLIPAGTAFNPHLNLKIKRLVAEPAAEEPRPVIPAALRPVGGETVPTQNA